MDTKHTKLAEFDVTEEQSICCPKCKDSDCIEPVEAAAPTWGEGRFWYCKDCQIEFEVRQIVREVGRHE